MGILAAFVMMIVAGAFAAGVHYRLESDDDD